MTCWRFSHARSWWIWPAEAGAGLPCRVAAAASLRASMSRLLAGLALSLAFAVVTAAPARADNWQANLYNEGLPSHLVAVDKNRRAFLFFEKKSPLKLKYSFPCVTGQLAGDKQQLNDLRTPEGIYFVEYKIASGLDFKEYGGIAYTLNYPNPVDRLRGKTGHGIWIHSKGFGLVPTRGCVAIGLKEIDTVGPQLTPGTAVVLAEQLDESKVPQPDNGTARELRRLMQAWSNAWAARSRKMFDYYDPESYSKATENFSAFRQNKERLFKMLGFVKIYNREIHALEGPGYWVTWAEQFYTASNLSTEGVRRLYWQRGKDKKFRIVGMEWTPRDVGMRADFQKGRLVAATVPVATDASSEAPLPPRLDMPEAPDEKTGPAAPPAAVAEKLLAVSEPLIPRRAPAPPPAEVNWGAKPGMDAARAESPAIAPAPVPSDPVIPAAPEAPAVPTAPAPPAPVTPEEAATSAAQPEAPAPAAPLPEAPALTPEPRAALEKAVQAWNKAFAARSADIAALYDQQQYNRLPGVPRGHSYNSVQRELERRFRAPWLSLISRAPVLEMQGPLAVTRSEQLVAGPNGTEQGVRTFWWRREADGSFRIVGSEFKPAELGLAADYLEDVSAAVSADLESWRKAWEAGRLDDYMAFYADDAVQQGRWGAKNIRRQKETLWARVKPTLVQLSGLRLVMDKRGIRADMSQVYADSAGHNDRGTKTLLMRFDGKNWRIQREDWAARAPAAPAGQSAAASRRSAQRTLP